MTTPLPDIDRAAAEAMWRAYADAHPETVAATQDWTVEYFGDSPTLADELLGLVLDGTKRATAALVVEFIAEGEALPRIGSHWIACDGAGVPRVVLRSTEFRLATFDEVDERFAFDEGEDDRTLATWREGHRRYWERTAAARGGTWSPEQQIVLERFTVVWPPEHRD
ncbi:ASCH domain-containing protein [Microcella alkaliphila]|uniref:ASCH domain-containing protein n=1 Tax=Microcella alkaliphila TaxID=279828 RepID=UPI000BBB0687|nr:ASCH domain-containing protein [Microcella alkaliphila]